MHHQPLGTAGGRRGASGVAPRPAAPPALAVAAAARPRRALVAGPKRRWHGAAVEGQRRRRPPTRAAAGAEEGATEPESGQQLLLAKVWYCLSGASGALLLPFVNVYLSQRGLPPSAIGLLSALRPWLAAPPSVAAASVADARRLHAQLLLGCCALAVALRSSLPLLGGTWWLAAALLASDMAGNPVNVLSDSTVLSHCKEAADYGRQRVWASVGYGLASVPSGWLIERAGLESCFPAYFLACLPLLLVGSRLRYAYRGPEAGEAPEPAAPAQAPRQGDGAWGQPARREPPAGPLRASGQPGPAAAVLLLLRQPLMLVFLSRCLLMGFSMGVMAGFEFLWLSQLGAPPTLLGLAIAASVSTEVPAFVLQAHYQRAAAPGTLLNLVLAATALRLAAYAALPAAHDVWLVLPVELLHGVTFGVGWAVATAQGSQLAPPGMRATVQGLWQAAYGGVGQGLGGLVGGVLMERAGGQVLFVVAAGLVAGCCLAAAVAERALQAAGAPGGSGEAE